MEFQSPEIGQLAEALAKAQGEIQGAIKDSENPFFKSTYADLASVWDACRGPLSKNKLAITQITETVENGICLITTVMHASGQWQRGVLPVWALKHEPQAMGSAITYARRYALAAITGVAQVDDDGEAAQGRSGGIHPDQLEPGDGFSKAGAPEYIIPFGKFAKRGLDEIDLNDLRSYVQYIENKAAKDGKPLQGQVLDFVQRATMHIAAFETGKATDFGSGSEG